MVPKTKAGLSGTWTEAVRPKPKCTRQTGRGLWYHIPVFCTDLNLFYSIYFPTSNSSVGWVWESCIQRIASVPTAIAHRHHNEASHQTIFAHQTCLACREKTFSRMKTLSGIYATELVKLTGEMDTIHINGKFSSTGAK